MEKDNCLSAFKFSVGSAAPLYQQLAEYLKHGIRSGAIKAGDRMVAENDVVRSLGISRTTVRQAYNLLCDEGLIVRMRGKGTFAAEPRLERRINYLYSFTENIRASGAAPSSEILACEVEPANAADRTLFGLNAPDARIFVLKRLRLANGEPMLVETTKIPYYLCSGIEKMDFSAASLYSVLRGEYGLDICRAVETIEAVILKKSDCAHLKCEPGMPGYAIERVARLDSGFICEHTASVTRADRCVFKLELTSSGRTREHGMEFERVMKFKPDA